VNHSIKSLAFVVIAVATAISSTTHAAPALYATGGGNFELSGLWTVDPANGDATLVWNLPGIAIYAGGLAYDPSVDMLYATGTTVADNGTSRLFKINRFTGATTALAGLSSDINISSGGLAISPVTGIMYATGTMSDIVPHQSTALFTIDKITGAATLVGYAGGNCCSGDFGIILYGLGFRSDGTLFANGTALGGPSFPDPSTSHLFTIDLATGLATNIGPSGVTLGRSLKYSGLAFASDGTLLSLGSLDAASGTLYSVNPASGAATPLNPPGLPYGGGPIHFGVDGGLTFAPTVPDTDLDTIDDAHDNCVLVPNTSQLDSDGDGYGNICDADFNNDGVVNINDLNRLKARLNIVPVVDLVTDLDGNGAVNINDLNRLKSYLGKPPGPSGLHPNCPPTCP
jgi:hypothetical protein